MPDDAAAREATMKEAAKKRESFLRRLELQQNQQQQKPPSPSKGDGEPEPKENAALEKLVEEVADEKAGAKGMVTQGKAKEEEAGTTLGKTVKGSGEGGGDEENRKLAGVVAPVKRSGGDEDDLRAAVRTPSKKPEEAEKSDAIGGGDIGRTDEVPPASSAPASSYSSDVREPPKEQSIGDQLLVDYLSQYCDASHGAPSSNPSEWIGDIDPSSLALLKGLAGIVDDEPAVTSLRRDPSLVAIGRTGSDSSARPDDGGAHTPPPFQPNNVLQVPEGVPTKVWEVYVPSDGVPGEPFSLMAGGVRVRVVCPRNAGPGQRIRFHLPLSLFDRLRGGPAGAVEYPPPVPAPPMTDVRPFLDRGVSASPGAEEGGGERPARPSSSFPSVASNANTTHNTITDADNGDDAAPSLQRRMLAIIERQQSQMQEMQARLDALGGMMAAMEQDVRYLRQGNEQGQPPRMFGGLFYGGGDQRGVGRQPPTMQPSPAANQAGQQPQQLAALNRVPQPPPQPPQRQRLEPQAEEVQPPQAVAQPVPNRPPNAGAVAAAVPQAAPPAVHQGIFFPLFVLLFRFLFSLPGRVRNLLLRSGPGRVYAHLRERARARGAFANVDLASIVKLLVMLLIFTGRVGRDDGGSGRNRRAAAARGGGGRDADATGEEEVMSMVAHARTLLRSLAAYWRGHRVHALVVASLVAFLIQVGLMSFLYQVLWVERAELLRAFLGQGEAERGNEQHEDAAAGGGGDAGGRANRAGVAPPVGLNGGRGNVDRGRDPAGRHPVGRADDADAAAAPPLPNVGGGMIRRGPNNGGFFHDIQCLALSFLLSLVPAWRPEEAAGPAPEDLALPEGGPGRQRQWQPQGADAHQPGANEPALVREGEATDGTRGDGDEDDIAE